MHHRTVSVTLHMCLKTLMCITPSNIENFVTWSSPSLETLQPQHESLSALCINKIDKGISKTTPSTEVNRKVHQIVEAFETMPIEQLQQPSSGVTTWNIAQHQTCLWSGRLQSAPNIVGIIADRAGQRACHRAQYTRAFVCRCHAQRGRRNPLCAAQLIDSQPLVGPTSLLKSHPWWTEARRSRPQTSRGNPQTRWCK